MVKLENQKYDMASISSKVGRYFEVLKVMSNFYFLILPLHTFIFNRAWLLTTTARTTYLTFFPLFCIYNIIAYACMCTKI